MSRKRSAANEGFTLIELLIVVAIIGIIAAIAIPSLLRARVNANEAGVIADTRTWISAEVAYHSASGGFYATPTCLSVPSGAGCIPGYPAQAPAFLDPSITSLAPSKGYSHTFSSAVAGPGGLSCYSYNSTPVVVNKTGVRGFGGDCSARICATPDGSPVPQVNAVLQPGCAQIN